MNSIRARVERLERLVNRAADSPCVSTLCESGGGWRLDFGTWNGKPGGGQITTTYHDTEDKAREHYSPLMGKFKADAPLLILDV